jgi:hypothetical protein
VEHALHDQEAFAFDPADEAMLLGDPPGPPAFEIVIGRFGLADACEWKPRS